MDFLIIQHQFEHMELWRILVPKMCVCSYYNIYCICLMWLQGEGEHKRSKQIYPWVHKGDHVCRTAWHVYRERQLFQSRQAFKKKTLTEKNADENTLNIPLREVEVLGPTPPEQHHHISTDVCHKVDILKWVMDNHDDPALTVCTSSLLVKSWYSTRNSNEMLEFYTQT